MLHSGKFSCVNNVSTMRQWSVNESETQPKGVSSNSQLGTFRMPGVRKWNGNFQGYGDTPPVMPGEQFTFTGYTAPANDVAGTAGMGYTGLAVVSSVAINWNWRTAAILGFQVNFEGHLALTKGNQLPAIDVSQIQSPSVIGTTFTWDKAAPTAVLDIVNLTQATLNISTQIQSYVNSHTVVGGICWTGNVGGPIDYNITMQQEDDSRDLTGDLIVGDLISLNLYVDASRKWDIKYGRVREYTGITCNRETGAIIGRTINVDMCANDGVNMGRINRPDGTTWWPASPTG